jgi:peptidoglycan/LPS O-acetylase OafA/YrhL
MRLSNSARLTRFREAERPAASAYITYRPDIDGIRALSICAVVSYHAFPNFVPGGFVGVDVFFVISGFLITGIILNKLASDSFSILSFYQRRIRRLFPALVVVLVSTYALGWAILLPSDFTQMGENELAGAGFFANLLQLREANYFAPAAATNPLLHLWSLGIEEQFYIFWPLLLVAIARLKRSGAIVVFVLAALSMGANLYLVSNNPTIAFYSPITRAWELFAGASLVYRMGALPRDQQFPNVKAIVGVVLIAIAIFTLDKSSKYPGWGATLPVAGTMLLLSARQSFFSKSILSNPAVVFVGLISYPLYLWHWPILVYVGILKLGTPTQLENLLCVILAFLLSWATYRFIEQPIRRRPGVVATLSVSMIAIAAVAVATVLGSGFPFRFPEAIREITSVRMDATSFRSGCFLQPTEDASHLNESACIEQGSGPVVFIWGDSTSVVLYAGLKAEQQTRSFRIAQFGASSCRPIRGYSPPGRPYCEQINERIIEIIRRTPTEILLLHGVWSTPKDFEKLAETIKLLKTTPVRRIIILGSPPWTKRGLPQMALNYFRLHHTLLPLRITDQLIGSETDAALAKFSADVGVEYISAWHAFCDANGCITRTGSSGADLVAVDSDHLTKAGSLFLIRSISQQLFAPSAVSKLGVE